jgi:hypothetical protein
MVWGACPDLSTPFSAEIDAVVAFLKTLDAPPIES